MSDLLSESIYNEQYTVILTIEHVLIMVTSVIMVTLLLYTGDIILSDYYKLIWIETNLRFKLLTVIEYVTQVSINTGYIAHILYLFIHVHVLNLLTNVHVLYRFIHVLYLFCLWFMLYSIDIFMKSIKEECNKLMSILLRITKETIIHCTHKSLSQ